jgi:SAM-dependent methyltransferase
MNCPLCQSTDASPFTVTKKPPGNYFLCAHCDLIFMDPAERLSAAEEKERYDLHVNDDSAGYRQFLEPLVGEIEKFAAGRGIAPKDLQVLDYGCGPTAFFAKLLAEKSYVTDNYDLFYFTNQSPLQRSYDVIISTEVWEHFFHPHEEIEQLTKLLKPKGILAIMTSAHQSLEHFQDWHYRRDPTHVIFFSEKTMQWIADHFGMKLVTARSPYWIFESK